VLLEDFRSSIIRKNAAIPPDDLFLPYLGADGSQTSAIVPGQLWRVTGGPVNFYWHFYPPPYVFPTGFMQNYILSGSFTSAVNRLRFRFFCDRDVPRRVDGGGNFDMGTYVKSHADVDGNNQGMHYYHTFNPNIYKNRWCLVEINRQPQHQVGAAIGIVPPLDPEWVAPTSPLNPVHYFDGLTRWYFGDTNAPQLLNATCYFTDFYLDTVANCPDDVVSTIVATYSGSAYELTWQCNPENVVVTYNVRYSTTSMKPNSFASGTDGGQVSSPGNNYKGVYWTSPPMPESPTGIFLAVQPVGAGNPLFTEVFLPSFSASGGPNYLTSDIYL
jgi:hypothetical protein